MTELPAPLKFVGTMAVFTVLVFSHMAACETGKLEAREEAAKQGAACYNAEKSRLEFGCSCDD